MVKKIYLLQRQMINKIHNKFFFYVLASLIFTLAIFSNVNAQLKIDPVFQNAYQKGTRDVSGAPGKNYWQNRADYQMQINFNPETRLIKGTVEIKYINNSPDNLEEIWFKLYPNLYKKGVPRKSKLNERDLGEGVKITSISINNQSKDTASLIIDGTNMHTKVPTLAAGKSMNFKIEYQYELNKGSHQRTGQVDEGAHFIAYFFPRVAVYDDVDGWNKIPYSGAEEFYNDFSNFKVAITVPTNYGVWATGDLVNGAEVLSKNVFSKLQQAEKSETTIDVIDSSDLANNTVTAEKPFNTFKFDAKNVVDFAFATSNHYLWKSNSLIVDPTTKRRTRVDAVFNAKHKDYYEVIDFARKTVHAMSYNFPKWPFPYPHITVFDGLDQMEYPMMVNDNPTSNTFDAITLTDHEIFHTMFPFYMGINETKYGWMDEGWATIGEWLISPMIDTTIVDDYGVAQTGSLSGGKDDVPVVRPTTELKGVGTFINNYPKPGFGYLFVKEYLGEERFTKALHHYIKNWNGKHPMPLDFFYSINTGAGENLDWFWKPWFFETGILDLAIKDVVKTAAGYQIVVQNKSNNPLPVHLTLTYQDGTTEKLNTSIVAWKNGNKDFTKTIETSKSLKKVVLGSSHVPDKDKSDNTFTIRN